MPDLAPLSRRDLLAALCAAPAALASLPSLAASAGFDKWVASFRARAAAKGVSDDTYARVMTGLKPDTSVYALVHNQDEFKEQLWQYLNRRASDWRIITGKERARDNAALLGRIERDYGVDRHIMLSLWGIESSYGDVITNPKYMRPVILRCERSEPRRMIGRGGSFCCGRRQCMKRPLSRHL